LVSKLCTVVVWELKTFGLVDIYRYFGGFRCLNFQNISLLLQVFTSQLIIIFTALETPISHLHLCVSLANLSLNSQIESQKNIIIIFVFAVVTCCNPAGGNQYSGEILCHHLQQLILFYYMGLYNVCRGGGGGRDTVSNQDIQIS
jgi:hypothetical protein